MPLYTLPEVKKELKKMYSVKNITITIEEFGEGFDVHANVWFIDKYLNSDFINFQMIEEETFSKAEKRAKSAFESLQKLDHKISYEGLANC